MVYYTIKKWELGLRKISHLFLEQNYHTVAIILINSIKYKRASLAGAGPLE